MKRLTVILVALGLLAALTGCDAAPKTFSLETAAEQRGASFADACTALGLSAEADADPSEAVFSAPDSVTLADKTFNIGFIAAPDAAETVGGLQITRTAAQEDAEAEGALALEVYDLLVESFGEPDRPDGASDSLYFADADAEALAGGAVGRDTWDDGLLCSGNPERGAGRRRGGRPGFLASDCDRRLNRRGIPPLSRRFGQGDGSQSQSSKT